MGVVERVENCKEGGRDVRGVVKGGSSAWRQERGGRSEGLGSGDKVEGLRGWMCGWREDAFENGWMNVCERREEECGKVWEESDMQRESRLGSCSEG